MSKSRNFGILNFEQWRISASHILVIKSLAKYHATAGCNEITFMVKALPRRGFEPLTFRFTKGCQNKELCHHPQYHDVKMKQMYSRLVINRLCCDWTLPYKEI